MEVFFDFSYLKEIRADLFNFRSISKLRFYGRRKERSFLKIFFSSTLFIVKKYPEINFYSSFNLKLYRRENEKSILKNNRDYPSFRSAVVKSRNEEKLIDVVHVTSICDTFFFHLETIFLSAYDTSCLYDSIRELGNELIARDTLLVDIVK